MVNQSEITEFGVNVMFMRVVVMRKVWFYYNWSLFVEDLCFFYECI